MLLTNSFHYLHYSNYSNTITIFMYLCNIYIYLHYINLKNIPMLLCFWLRTAFVKFELNWTGIYYPHGNPDFTGLTIFLHVTWAVPGENNSACGTPSYLFSFSWAPVAWTGSSSSRQTLWPPPTKTEEDKFESETVMSKTKMQMSPIHINFTINIIITPIS